MRCAGVVAIGFQLFSKLCFKNLAVVVLRQTVQESIILGTLETSNVFQTKIVQLLLTGLLEVRPNLEGVESAVVPIT